MSIHKLLDAEFKVEEKRLERVHELNMANAARQGWSTSVLVWTCLGAITLGAAINNGAMQISKQLVCVEMQQR